MCAKLDSANERASEHAMTHDCKCFIFILDGPDNGSVVCLCVCVHMGVTMDMNSRIGHCYILHFWATSLVHIYVVYDCQELAFFSQIMVEQACTRSHLYFYHNHHHSLTINEKEIVKLINLSFFNLNSEKSRTYFEY